MPNAIDRFERDHFDGNDLSIWQMIFFLPLLTCLILRNVWRMWRDRPRRR